MICSRIIPSWCNHCRHFVSYLWNCYCFSLPEMCRWQLCTKHTDARPHTESGKRSQWTQLLCFICLWNNSGVRALWEYNTLH